MKGIPFTYLVMSIVFQAQSQWNENCYNDSMNVYSDSLQCLSKINWLDIDSADNAELPEYSFWRKILVKQAYTDTNCFCAAYYQAKEDSVLKLMASGDPGHIYQIVYHKYAEKGVKLVMTGDIARQGQEKYNEGYNLVSKKRIKTKHPFWSTSKPFTYMSRREKGLNDREIGQKIESNLTIEATEDNRIRLKLEKKLYAWNFKNSKITVLNNWKDFGMNTFSIEDLYKGLDIDLSSIDENSKSVVLEVNLKEFKHPNYNWTLGRRNICHVQILPTMEESLSDF